MAGEIPAPVVVEAELIRSPEPQTVLADEAPRTPFWDHAPSGSYVQFDERRITAWERVSLGGFDLPGRCTVASPGRVRKVRTNSGPGDEAEEIIDLGASAAEVQIVVQVWTQPHLRRWEDFNDIYQRQLAKVRAEKVKGEADAPAMDVVHPGLNLAGIRSIYVYQVSVLAPSGTKGVMESTILGTEFRSRKKKATKKVLAPVANSLDGLDSTTLSPEIQPKPKDTEVGP